MLKLGSVVYLKGTLEQFMIISRFAPEIQNEKEVYFDYLLVKMPIGIGDELGTIVANEIEIDKVVYHGYSDAIDEQHVKDMKEMIQKENIVKGVTR